jgi:hypothetical protein
MNDGQIDHLSEVELLDLREKIGRRLEELANRPAIKPGEPVKLAALAVQDRTVRCRTLDGQHRITLRPTRGRHLVVEGHVLTVLPSKQRFCLGDLERGMTYSEYAKGPEA